MVCGIEVIIPSCDAVETQIIPPKVLSADVLPLGVRDVTASYEGQYEYTPSDEIQTIEIEGLKATQNITINPIPSDYGHIAWNGSTLMVY